MTVRCTCYVLCAVVCCHLCYIHSHFSQSFHLQSSCQAHCQAHLQVLSFPLFQALLFTQWHPHSFIHSFKRNFIISNGDASYLLLP